MSPGPRGPANWVWARGGTCLSVLHRWCETQASLHTWNIQILPAASLWSCCNRHGKTERVGGRKQQKQEEEQHTWDGTDWHFLRENKQSQVSCVAPLQLVVSGESGPSWWWLHLWSLPPTPTNWPQWLKLYRNESPTVLSAFPLWKKKKKTLSPILLFEFHTVTALLICYASPSKNFETHRQWLSSRLLWDLPVAPPCSHPRLGWSFGRLKLSWLLSGFNPLVC